MSPIMSDCRLGLVPTHRFADCPPLDLICIPGGSEGVAGVLNDRERITFVRQQAAPAKYVTSVCTGALVLGVAGLLKGRRATSHWANADLLPLVGATHEKARVVIDGNVITSSGIPLAAVHVRVSPKWRRHRIDVPVLELAKLGTNRGADLGYHPRGPDASKADRCHDWPKLTVHHCAHPPLNRFAAHRQKLLI
jgi:hypothetical protein